MKAGACTVFVVDDEASVRKSLTRLLRSAGWWVEAFSSADAFLERLPIDEAGCVVLDVSMPGMSGPELHDQLLQRGSTLPVIFLTGRGDVPMSVQQMKRGAVDFLLKPVEDQVLQEAIRSALEQYAGAQLQRLQRDGVALRVRQLTVRERQVLDCMLGGYLNKQTALTLGIAEKTVKVHRGRVMEKMDAHSIAELVHQCELAGVQGRRLREATLIRPPDQ